MPSPTYDQYRAHMQSVAHLRSAAAVLQWDEETGMPPGATEARGHVLATLAEAAHTRFVDPALGEILEALRTDAQLNTDEARNAELTGEDYRKATRYSAAFVRSLAKAQQAGFHAWVAARQAADFSLFAPHLERLLALKRQEVELLGWTGHPYNALLNEHERGATVETLDLLFDELLPPLQGLMQEIAAGTTVDDSFLRLHYPADKQLLFINELLGRLGFDAHHMRQDLSEHPFTTAFHPTDVRFTTRIDAQDFGVATWSSLHEWGHALYEAGLDVEHYGLPLGEATSLGMHESQSRFWENNLGRSLSFWQTFFPLAQAHFPAQLGAVSAIDFYKAINRVQPSLIRTEADEVSYHFHVAIRYWIEKELIEGSLEVRDLPQRWNALYKTWLGIEVPNDRVGCLQDVHWSHGSFGYFPTYSLGSLYAAGWWEHLSEKEPSTLDTANGGDFLPLVDWLRRTIHRPGRKYLALELYLLSTGSRLHSANFLRYLTPKYTSMPAL